MGYTEEPFDGEGGYDIYIMSYAAGVYGYNYKDNGSTSYLQIDNDYVGFNSIFNLTPMQIMQITVGHEYFHGIQWGYRKNKSGNEYFYEMTSMWFEDILIPDGNDYIDGWADHLQPHASTAVQPYTGQLHPTVRAPEGEALQNPHRALGLSARAVFSVCTKRSVAAASNSALALAATLAIAQLGCLALTSSTE